ncbi:radical SAM protein [Variovorax sp. J22R133]|uniref:radical SAM protein n=1 Tax=Variovorax brevis TaxID=3053503 RepID=UPI0025790F43|nr:radical SAM protein [Variovorax sp. J22R133]MDM0110670.1 radical SAM protein [Variovorax sp. J22R133]
MDPHLPLTVCFRVTRYCNARCSFCLAPPDGAHPPAGVLKQRLDWLAARGVRTIHFCGGEPTIHPALAELLEHVQRQGGGSLMTTNGIALPAQLLPALRAAGTRVKVSLHGDRAHHDATVGRAAFDLATGNLRRLLAFGIPTSVQTTVVAGGDWVVDWMADFCLAERVPRLSILPFIPRGSGLALRDALELASRQHAALREQVRRKRRALQGRLDVRWLDFSARPVHVVEADGRVVLERASEAMDTQLCVIPSDTVVRKRVPIRPLTSALAG